MQHATRGRALGPDRRPFLLCVGGPGSSLAADGALGPGAEFELDGAEVSALPAQDLVFELTALLGERDALVIAAAQAELQQELAAAAVETARRRYDAAVLLCREASTTAATARRALSRHEAAIAEVRAELSPAPIA